MLSLQTQSNLVKCKIISQKKERNTGKNAKSTYRRLKVRLECSFLKLHLFSKNLVDSPYSACGEIENGCDLRFS
jgi:hypothetical protein